MDHGLGQNGFGRGDELAIDSALPQTLTPNPSPRGERGTALPQTLTPKPSPTPRWGRGEQPRQDSIPRTQDTRILDDEAILVAVATNLSPATDIARQAGISILELARVVTTPANLKQLEQVAKLHAIEREMMLGKLQRHALGRLAELSEEVGAADANEVRASEVMRKACVDILRVGNTSPRREGRPSNPGARRNHRQPLVPASEAEVLEVLNNWGKEESQYEPRTKKSGSVEQAGWSKAEPQAMSGGREGVVGVEVTDDVQVGMAFTKTSDHGPGKTSDHGTLLDHAEGIGRRACCCSQRRTASGSVPPADERRLRPLRGHHRRKLGREWDNRGCRSPPS